MEPASPPKPEASWRLGSLIGWLAGLSLGMIVLAWLFVEIELAGYAWFGLLPLLMGLACGLVSGCLLRVTGMPHVRTAILLTALAGVGLSIGQHYFHYREYGRRRTAAVTGQVDRQGLAAALIREMGPTGFDKYMLAEARNGRFLFGLHLNGAWSWVVWSCEGLLIVVAAVLTARAFVMQPFCPTCHRWYCTVRQGQLTGSLPTELAQLVNVPPSGGVLSYRLLACPEGTGPTGLDVSWEAADRAAQPHRTTRRVWIDPDDRNRLTSLLDRAAR